MRRVWGVGLLLCLLAGGTALASTFVAMTPRELVAKADAVIQGRVVDLHSFWSESGRIIVTEALVEVEETLVGSAPTRVSIRTFGGEVGGYMVEAHGFPRFEAGERLIVFLTTNRADGSLRVLGYLQGHFRLITRLDGVTLAVPMLDEEARYITANGDFMPEPESLELGRFKAELRDLAERAGRLRQ